MRNDGLCLLRIRARRHATEQALPSQNFCRQMLLDPKIGTLDAFCGIKNTQKSILADPVSGGPHEWRTGIILFYHTRILELWPFR